jgi:hypothetical protein
MNYRLKQNLAQPPEVVLEVGAEELRELLVALCLGILDVGLQRLYVF